MTGRKKAKKLQPNVKSGGSGYMTFLKTYGFFMFSMAIAKKSELI